MTRLRSVVLAMTALTLLSVPGCSSEPAPMESMTWARLDISFPPGWEHRVDGTTIHFSPSSADSSLDSEYKAEFVVAVVWSGSISANAAKGFAESSLVVETPKRALRPRPVEVAACESFRVDAETGFARHMWVLTGREDHRVLLYAWVHPPEGWRVYGSTFDRMVDELSCLAWL